MKTRYAAVAALACLHAASVLAAVDHAAVLTPARPGLPLAHPIASGPIAPPPLSLMAERPVKPAYVPGLPGLPQYRMVTDDFGRKIPKYDGVVIRQSRVENGEVVIPPGGLYYVEDTWGGEVALRGNGGAPAPLGSIQSSGVNGASPCATRALSHCALGAPDSHEGATSRHTEGRCT